LVNSRANLYIYILYRIDYILDRIFTHVDIEFSRIHWSLYKIKLRYFMKVWFLLFSFGWELGNFLLGGFKEKEGFLSTLLYFIFPYIINSIKMQLSSRKKRLLCLISLVWSAYVLILSFIRVVFSSPNCPKPTLFWIQS